MGWIRHPKGGPIFTGKDSVTMDDIRRRRKVGSALAVLALIFAFGLVLPASQAQSGTTPSHSQPPAAQQDQNIPDAPSTVQPPPKIEPQASEESSSHPQSNPSQAGQGLAGQTPANESTPPPPMPPVETLPPGTPIPGSAPRNQINPAEGLYKFVVVTNFVQVPVMVKNSIGAPVYGLLPQDFTVKENGKIQTLTYFTSDPYPLSVAILLDIGMPDVDLQRVNETYSALVGAFSPYDEVALYTYSSIVSQVVDFTRHSEKLSVALNEMKLVHGRSNGPPILNGPLANGPMVNGMPVGGPEITPVNTPPKENHVLNDAILRAAVDLGKREKGRRKVILVISDGREFGSQASYRDVLKVLQTRDIQVKGVVVDVGTLPVIHWIEDRHLKGQGYSDLVDRYARATGGGQVYGELTRNTIEKAYVEIASDARNQYTLGYIPQAVTGSSAYRSVEVIVHKKGLKVTAKDGYYAVPTAR